MLQNNKICRTCLYLGNTTFFPLDATIPNFDLIPIKEKISLCVPGLSLDIVPDAVICSVCSSALHTAFLFLKKCRQTEDLIQNYIHNTKSTLATLNLKKIIIGTDLSYQESNAAKAPDIGNIDSTTSVQVKDSSDNIPVGKVEYVEYSHESNELKENCESEEFDKVPTDHAVFNLDFVSGSKPYKCLVCGKGYKREIGLTAHMRVHAPKHIIATRQTQLKNSIINKIKQFLPDQTDNIQAVCEICQKTFYSKSNLTVHMRIHTGEKPYQCNTCNKAFTQKVYLTAHERIHTGEKPYKCSLCEKSFAQKSYLRTHMIVHTGVRHHICKVCGKGCAHTGDLNNHMRIHTGEKPYKCIECGKCFTQSVHLKSHIKIHSGVKPYPCQFCDSGYTEKRYLKKHMRIHTDARPYKCDICNLKFSDRYGLIEHSKRFHERYIVTDYMQEHTEQKVGICVICNEFHERFNDASHLIQHMQAHRAENPYSCGECVLRFKSEDILNAHMQVHKKDDEVENSTVVIKSEKLEPSTSSAYKNYNMKTEEAEPLQITLDNRDLKDNDLINNFIKAEPCVSDSDEQGG